MATYTLATLAKYMRQMDICMMVTQSKRGPLNSRPMSNNGDVKYNGNSYFFTYEGSQKLKDIEANPQVSLNFEGAKDLYLSVSGKAKLIRNKKQFAEHWVDSLSQWFKDGIDTPGMVLIHVKGNYLQYWQKNKEGKIRL
jgi:general stress protein 26